jgi:hypothetical protein
MLHRPGGCFGTRRLFRTLWIPVRLQESVDQTSYDDVDGLRLAIWVPARRSLTGNEASMLAIVACARFEASAKAAPQTESWPSERQWSPVLSQPGSLDLSNQGQNVPKYG